MAIDRAAQSPSAPETLPFFIQLPPEAIAPTRHRKPAATRHRLRGETGAPKKQQRPGSLRGASTGALGPRGPSSRVFLLVLWGLAARAAGFFSWGSSGLAARAAGFRPVLWA